MDPIRVGVIGLGGHAQGHIQMIHNEPGMRLTALCEVDPDRLARQQAVHGVEHGFADYRRMLDTCALDAVYVITRARPLAAIVCDCLQKGLWVSVEKPVGMNGAETQKMADVAGQNGGKAIVSFNRRYFPEVLAVRRLLQERGGAVQCAAVYHKPVSGETAMVRSGDYPVPIVCDAIHHVDLLRWLAGTEPEKAAAVETVYADSGCGPRPGTQRYGALIRFANGCGATLASHYGVGYRIQRAEAHAEDFSAYFDLTRAEKGCETYIDGALQDSLDLEPVGGPDYNETRHLLECMRDGKRPWSTLEDAVETMRLCEAINQGVKGPLPAP